MDNSSAAIKLIQSRMHRPRLAGAIISRQRLFALMVEVRTLTLISAPAGYGKTVLVNTWLETLDLPHAWLTLDASHNDPKLFVTYLLAAVRAVTPSVRTDVRVQSPTGASTPSLVDILLDEFDKIDRPMLVVLDDYHAIARNEVHAVVDALLQRMPQNLRLVLIARQDPPITLVSLRAHGRLTEVRTNALRFTQSETAAFLKWFLDAPVDDDTTNFLQEKTEGWITGLHLSARFIRDEQEIGAAIRRLQTNNPYALEYLTHDVLEHQSPAMQEFLITTSILDRLCLPLCMAVAGNRIAEEEVLQMLNGNSLFVYEVDNEPEWRRYQRLFQHELQILLHRRLTPDAIAVLHARASAWFAGEGRIEDALPHALAAGEMAVAVRLVAQNRHDVMNREEWRTLQHWVDRFDPAAVQRDPDLSLCEAWLLWRQGRVMETTPILERVDRMLEHAAPAAKTEAEYAALMQLRTEIDVLRCQTILVSVQPYAAIALANTTLARLPAEWHVASSFLLFSLAGAYQMIGALPQAYAVLEDAMTWPRAYPSVFHVRVLAAQGLLQWLAAELPAMLRTARQMLLLSEQLQTAEMRSWSAYYVGSVYYQWDNLAQAEEVLKSAIRQTSTENDIAFANASCALALTYQAQGRKSDALAVTNAAIDVLRKKDHVFLPTLKTFTAELALRQGDVAQAAQWVVQQTTSVPSVPAFHFFAPQLTRPKVLLALNLPAARREAAQLLKKAHDFFVETHNTRYVIETLVLLAMLHDADDKRADALDALDQALRLAAPGGLLRVLADAGPPLLPLLDGLASRTITPTFAAKIGAAIKREQSGAKEAGKKPAVDTGRAGLVQHAEPQVAVNVPDALIEGLTPRELDVLTALAQRLTSREIASALGISAHTVKSHISNILSKLQVADRRQAIARARELGILPPARRPS